MKKFIHFSIKLVLSVTLLVMLAVSTFAMGINVNATDEIQTNDLTLSRTNITLATFLACTDTFAITSNVTWTITIAPTANSTVMPTWLSVSPVSGSNNMIINIAAVPNTTTAIRGAIVKITYGTTTKQVEVHQPAAPTTVSFLNVSRTNITLPSYLACTDTFAVTSNVVWTAAVTTVNSAGNPITWLTVTPVNGSNNLIVNLAAQANTTTAARVAYVVVSSGTLSKTIEVHQPAASTTPASYLYVSRTNITLPSFNACTDTFAVTSNVSWTAAVTPVNTTGGPITWLTVTPVNGSNNLILNLSAAANTTSAARVAYVVVTSGTLSKTIEVHQPAAPTTVSYLNVSRTNITLSTFNACTDTFAVTSNVNWAISIMSNSSSATPVTWLTVAPITGSNNLIVNLSATANTTTVAKVAYVVVSSGTLSKTIEVHQPAASTTPASYLNVSRTNITLATYNACTDTFAVTSNVTWNAAVTPVISTGGPITWLTVTPVNGSNNLILNLSAAANTTSAARVAYVVVSSGTLSKTIEVHQPAAPVSTTPYLYVSRTTITLPSYNACVDTFKITSNVSWTATVTPVTATGNPITWLTVTPINGSNNLIANLSATANTTNAARVAYVVVTSGTLSKTIEVHQPAAPTTVAYLYVSRSNITLPSYNACNDTFKITSNVNWSITFGANSAGSTTPPTWLSVNPVSGSNNLIVNITAAANTTTAARVAYIIVSSGTLSKTIEVHQPIAPLPTTYLNVSRPAITLLTYNACTDTFKITSNVNWTISILAALNSSGSSTTIPTWLTVTPITGSNNMVINIAATANTANTPRYAYIKVTSGTMDKMILIKQVGVSPNPSMPMMDNDHSFTSTSKGNESTITPTITAYPNPTKDYLILNSAQAFSNNDYVDVYSMDGRKVLSQKLTGNTVKLDIQALKIGIYFIKITQNNEVSVKTISKN